MRGLRTEGYTIEAVRHRGYRLVKRPDRLLPLDLTEGLATTSLGRHIHAFETLPTTQDVARRLAEAGAVHGTLVIAEEQSAGRGRLGRGYWCPRGGIWGTVILRPALIPAEVQLISLAAGVAIAEGIEAATGIRTTLKWPNDLQVEGRKLAGVLTEVEAEESLVHFVLVGFGINANIPAAAFPPDLCDGATSLQAATGRPIARAALVQRVLERLEIWCERLTAEGPVPLLAGWRARPNILGRSVRVAHLQRVWEGVAADLDSTGALLLRTADGALQRVLAGDVTLRSAEGDGGAA